MDAINSMSQQVYSASSSRCSKVDKPTSMENLNTSIWQILFIQLEMYSIYEWIYNLIA